MSASQKESWAAAIDLLTNDECRLLLEVEDFFNDDCGVYCFTKCST